MCGPHLEKPTWSSDRIYGPQVELTMGSRCRMDGPTWKYPRGVGIECMVPRGPVSKCMVPTWNSSCGPGLECSDSTWTALGNSLEYIVPMWNSLGGALVECMAPTGTANIEHGRLSHPHLELPTWNRDRMYVPLEEKPRQRSDRKCSSHPG